jgi:3-phytase
MRLALLPSLLALIFGIGAPALTPVEIKPALKTDAVANDPDDPAVWVNRRAPARSLILGTNKTSKAEGGALYVFGLDGKTRQIIKGLDRPNNVDVEYGLQIGKVKVDIAVVTERLTSKIRVYAIRETAPYLKELTPGGIPVFAGQKDDFAAPMGIGLYRRQTDGTIFAIVGRKNGPKTNYLWQYRLSDNGNGGVKAVKVREFGNYSAKKEIESIAVDDAAGLIYYGDEGFGVHIWQADPAHPRARTEVGTLATTGWKGDHEGIAIYAKPDNKGYIVCTDQIPGSSEYHLYRRDTREEIAVVRGGSDETDGIEVVSFPLGTRFPKGLLITMNSTPKNFLIFDWQSIDAAINNSATRKPIR